MLVGVFESRDQAEQAVDALERAGFGADQIGFVTHDRSADRSDAGGFEAPTGQTTSASGQGVVSGVLGGGVLGGLIGAAASLLMPGIGPVVAGGILASTVAGAGLSAVAGGFVGIFADLGIPEEEARYYDGEYRAGRSLVTVKSDGRHAEAMDILRRFGASDFATRGSTQGDVGTFSTGPETGTPLDRPAPDDRR
ncbi:MAG TPA: general stress protein [Dehalococcoidia bacterium]|nr:general stress protein [Dehalococcoidia bacterium]